MFNPLLSKKSNTLPTLYSVAIQFLFLIFHQFFGGNLSKRNERIDRNTAGTPHRQKAGSSTELKIWQASLGTTLPHNHSFHTPGLSETMQTISLTSCLPSLFLLLLGTQSAMSSVMPTRNLRHGTRLFSRKHRDTGDSTLSCCFQFIGNGNGSGEFQPPEHLWWVMIHENLSTFISSSDHSKELRPIPCHSHSIPASPLGGNHPTKHIPALDLPQANASLR